MAGTPPSILCAQTVLPKKALWAFFAAELRQRIEGDVPEGSAIAGKWLGLRGDMPRRVGDRVFNLVGCLDLQVQKQCTHTPIKADGCERSSQPSEGGPGLLLSASAAIQLC